MTNGIILQTTRIHIHTEEISPNNMYTRWNAFCKRNIYTIFMFIYYVKSYIHSFILMVFWPTNWIHNQSIKFWNICFSTRAYKMEIHMEIVCNSIEIGNENTRGKNLYRQSKCHIASTYVFLVDLNLNIHLSYWCFEFRFQQNGLWWTHKFAYGYLVTYAIGMSITILLL